MGCVGGIVEPTAYAYKYTILNTTYITYMVSVKVHYGTLVNRSINQYSILSPKSRLELRGNKKPPIVIGGRLLGCEMVYG